MLPQQAGVRAALLQCSPLRRGWHVPPLSLGASALVRPAHSLGQPTFCPRLQAVDTPSRYAQPEVARPHGD